MNEQLLRDLLDERFGPAPTWELSARPTPMRPRAPMQWSVEPVQVEPDTPRAIARRRRELCEALDGAIGR